MLYNFTYSFLVLINKNTYLLKEKLTLCSFGDFYFLITFLGVFFIIFVGENFYLSSFYSVISLIDCLPTNVFWIY